MKIIVHWGLYWGPLILGNYHIHNAVFENDVRVSRLCRRPNTICVANVGPNDNDKLLACAEGTTRLSSGAPSAVQSSKNIG